MDKQLRRYKRRLRDHHRDRVTPVEFDGGSSYILAANEEHGQDEPESLQPMIIAEMEAKMPGRKDRMLRALSHVNPSHLLDPKLFDFASLAADKQKAGQ